MKKLNFILLCLLAAYLAGMYRYLPLMVLSDLGIVSFIVSFFLSRYFRRCLSVKALRQTGFAEKSEPFACSLKVENAGRLPIGRFRVRLWYGYGQGLGRASVKHIYGGSERGENIFQFEVVGKYCGMMYLKMSRLHVYDYLSLFGAPKKLGEEIKVAVFPRERALSIELPFLCCRENNLPRELPAGHGGEEHNEVRQLREYRPEDSNRYIHWNQSARMGQLWVKEYEKETDYKVSLFLDLYGVWEAGITERDRFYELLSALVLGLLKQAAAVRISWYDGARKCLADGEAANLAQCRDILLTLYGMERVRWEEADREAAESCIPQGFKLDMDLGWYWKESLIFRFSGEELDDQIAHHAFVVPG